MGRSIQNTVYLASPEKGVDGRTTIAKARAPLVTDGRIGDFFIDTIAKKLYGPKSAAGWPDNGLIKGDEGWSPVLSVTSDGNRRVFRISDWQGGQGSKPSAGKYIGAGSLVDTAAEAVDIRGPIGPEMLIDDMAVATDDITDATAFATADAGDDNVKRGVVEIFDLSGRLPRLSVTQAQASTVRKNIKTIVIDQYVYKRAAAEPSSDGKFRTLDRWTSAGDSDSANGGWWQIVIGYNPVFDTIASAQAAALAGISSIDVDRYAPSSSVARTTYRKVPQPANVQPASPLRFQSADGFWFVMSSARLDLSACGATADAAIANAVAHASGPTTMDLTADMTVAADVTVPKGWTLRVVGGRMTIASGKKLNIQGQIEAAQRQVFIGPGVVVGIKRPWLYWWHQLPSVDYTAALKAAIACIEAAETGSSDGHGHPQVLAGGGGHEISETIVFTPKLGSPTGLKGNGQMLGTASGTRFVSKLATGIFFYAKPSVLGTDSNRLCSFRFQDFVLDEGYGSANTVTGFYVGDASGDTGDPNNGSRVLDSASTLNVIEGVHVREFFVNMRWTNLRKVLLTNSKLESQTKVGKSLIIDVQKAGRFSGDSVIDRNVEITQPANQGTCIEISTPNTLTANAEIRGLHILTGTIYGGQYKINIDVRSNATYSASVGHCWWDGGHQLDAGFATFSSYGIYLGAYGPNSRIEELEFNSPYFSGISTCGIYSQVFTDGTGYGIIQAITVSSPIFNYCVNELAHFEGGRGISIDKAKIYDCGRSDSTATRYFYFNAVSDFSLTLTKRIKNDPTGWPGGTIVRGVQIDNGCSNYTVRGNSFLTTTPVNDNVSATNRDVAANW